MEGVQLVLRSVSSFLPNSGVKSNYCYMSAKFKKKFPQRGWGGGGGFHLLANGLSIINAAF